MITASSKNEYFFDILIPREFQKEVKEQFKSDINLEFFAKKKNNGNCEFNFQLEFEKLCKKSKCEEFPDRGLAYIRNHTMLLEGRNFDWKKYSDEHLDFTNLLERLENFVNFQQEDIRSLKLLQHTQINFELPFLKDCKLCILKYKDKEFLIQIISEDCVRKFGFEPLFVKREFHKLEIADCAYLYKLRQLPKPESDFLKVLLGLIQNQKLSQPRLLHDLYKQNQTHRKSLSQKVRQSILQEQEEEEKRQLSKKKLEQYQSFLDLMFYLKTFKKNFEHFATIQKEIKFFVQHSSVLQKKGEGFSHFFQYKPETIFQDLVVSQKPCLIESDCAVCFSCEASPSNNVTYCAHCGQGAHVRCLGWRESPESDYFCGFCPEDRKANNRCCFFCKRKDFLLLKADRKRNNQEVYYHLFCQVALRKWNFISDNELLRGKQVCKLCEKSEHQEFLLDCQGCRESLHPICGYKEGFYFDVQNIESQNFEDFRDKKFTYQVDVYCESCDLEKLKPAIMEKCDFDYQQLIKLNKQYRSLSVCPQFYQNFLDSEDFKNIVLQLKSFTV